MKRLFILCFFSFFCHKSFCQSWTPLGSNEQSSNSIALTAASTFFTQISDDGTPYISYIDDVGNGDNLGDFKVHARKFDNGQWKFAGNAISPVFPGSDDFPVTVDDNVPYVAYSEGFTPIELSNKLTIKKLNSTTQTWEVVGQQGLSDGSATGSVLTASNGKIFVAYTDGAFESKITVKVYDNAHPLDGWQTVGTPGFSNGFVLGTNIAIDNGTPYIAYLDFGDDNVYVKKFNGTVWENVGTNNPSAGIKAVVRSLKFNSAHIPFIAFVDVANGAGVVRNLNDANAWVTTGGGSFATSVEEPVSLAVLNDNIFVAFGKKQNGITQANVKRFSAANNSWADAGSQPVTASLSAVNNIALLRGGNNKLFMAFRDLNGGIYAKTFDAGSVLPVSLTKFYVAQEGNTAFLKWTTVSEFDNKLFEIEHSIDAVNFVKIGEVPAKLTTDIERSYDFSDNSPSPKINYYRLKQVDKNGGYTYSKIISLSPNHQHPLITIFPNPVTSLLHISTPANAGTKFFISNTEGKIIRRIETISNFTDINVTNLSRGIYFVNFYGFGKSKVKSFVKQ